MNIKKSGLIALALFTAVSLQAQYFGRNKPRYEQIEYRVHQTPHFEIYHYLDNDTLLHALAEQSERWYRIHQAVLKDTIVERNPLIFYNDHPDFQQTNTISGDIGVGTGGVTEAFKNRVILPLAMSNQQTHHVLGHELVHAFQYNMILKGDSTSLNNLSNLPLWMVEGLAEYMSIGSVDAQTAMWMRDAVLNDDVPTLKKLNNPQYFPYRYGHTFWVFVTGLKGDEIIEPLFMATAKYGFEQACKMVMGMSSENLSELWVTLIKKHFGGALGDKKERTIGKALINDKNAGRMNISPVLSPNGQFVIFLSEKNLFTTDLFLADARTGKIIRRVASTLKDGHIDDFSYIESSGTWSPDSKQFAFVGVSQGGNILIIKEVQTGKTILETPLEGVPAFTNPAWSPDGKTIALTGLANGQVDIFTYNIKSKKVTQLTNNRYSEMHPAWSEDGSFLAFATDELSMNRGKTNGKWTFNLATLNIADNRVNHIDIFPGADNLNPIPDTANNIIFLSDRDGFRNIYQYEPTTGKVYQLTDLLTGVSGITSYSPAISLARRNNRIAYTHYLKNGYNIYRARLDEFLYKEVDPKAVDMSPAHLPRVNRQATALVDANLDIPLQPGELPADQIKEQPYKSKFKLDYVGGGGGIGIGTSNAFGTTSGVAGGVDLLFSDIMGNHQFFSSLSLNGEISDIGGTVAYINRKKRINWGGYISHTPYRSLSLDNIEFDYPLPVGDDLFLRTDRYEFSVYRLFEDQLGFFAQYPFSTTTRVEVGASGSIYSNQLTKLVNYYDDFGNLIKQDRTKLDAPPSLNLVTAEAALVGDNSFFGMTAPLQGQRYRLGLEQYFGDFNFTALTADYRIYRFYKPVAFAFRAMHYGRYGAGSTELNPLFVGNPWFIRGYNSNTALDLFLQNDYVFDQLVGSKLLVANFEVRIPFTGPKRLALIKSNVLLTDLNFFVDGGVTWFDYDQFSIDEPQFNGEFTVYPVQPVFSAGASLRINLFGALILEPYYAIPLQKNTKGTFGLNLIPGW